MTSKFIKKLFENFSLIKNWPNSYTFTKACAETLVQTSSVDLPICIVRPGIVLGTYCEPSPGWIDNTCLNGASGLIFGAGLGIIHTILASPNVKMAIVPCDYVNNAIIVAARETASTQAKGGHDTKIYTLSTTHRNPVTYNRIFKEIIETEAKKLITPKSLYYVFNITTDNKLWFYVLSLFLYIIPAYIADFVCVLMGKRRRFTKLASKLHKAITSMSYFALNEWNFVDNNTEKLYSNLSKQDQAIFNFDVSCIDWVEFVLAISIGLRKYIYKDGLKGTEYAIKKQKFLQFANYIIMSLYAYCVWKVLCLVFYLGKSLVLILL